MTADIEDHSTFFFLDSQDKSAVIAENMYYLTQEGNVEIFLNLSLKFKSKVFLISKSPNYYNFNNMHAWYILT